MMPGNAHIAMSGNKETCCNWQPFPGSPLLHHGENWKNPELPVHTGGANLNGVVVGVQPLHPGELCHIRGGVQHGIPVHAHHAGAALELVRPQAGKRLAGAAGRQRMAGTRQKIPAGYSRKGACVNGARRPDAIKYGLFIPSDKHQMLRRKGINQFHPFLNGRNRKP